MTIEIPDDELIGGVWRLDGRRRPVDGGEGATPCATLTAAGFSALLYGVLDPVEVVTRGLGELSPRGGRPARIHAVSRAEMPYLFADF